MSRLTGDRHVGRPLEHLLQLERGVHAAETAPEDDDASAVRHVAALDARAKDGFHRPVLQRRTPSGIQAVVTRQTVGWREYAIEGVLLAAFMASATVWATVLQHPASPVAALVRDDLVRRLVMGAAMGGTAVALIYSRLGARTGAHMNPAVTLAYWRLGMVDAQTAVGYCAAQVVGAVAGEMLVSRLLNDLPASPAVGFVATVPGPSGPAIAFLAELTISTVLMALVLTSTRITRLAPYTGLLAGAFVALCIVVEAPLSGMSMNPARSLGSNLLAQRLDVFWIYLIAPTLAMQLVAMLFARTADDGRVRWCPRLYHPSWSPCVFGCGDSAAIRETPSRSRSDAQHTL